MRELPFYVVSRTQRSKENRKGKENHASSECQLKFNLTFCKIVPLDKVLNGDLTIVVKKIEHHIVQGFYTRRNIHAFRNSVALVEAREGLQDNLAKRGLDSFHNDP